MVKKKKTKSAKKKKKKTPSKKPRRLKPAEELFCQLYAGDSECFNNGTMAYATAFKYDLFGRKGMKDQEAHYKKRCAVAGVLAHRLLGKVKILKRCEEVLNEAFKERIADGELYWIIKQRKDLGSKIRAISEYNRLKGRIVDRIAFTGEVKHDVSDKRKKELNKLFDDNK